MSFFTSLKNFLIAFKNSGKSDSATSKTSKGSGVDIEVEKNRPC